MSNKKDTIVAFLIIALAVAIGGLIASKVSGVPMSLGAAGTTLFTGSSTQGEVSVATTGTEVVPRTAERQYLLVCRTNQQSSMLTQVTLAVNASPSHGRGIVLDSTNRCWESTDLNLVSGEINAVASPSAASLSYTQW